MARARLATLGDSFVAGHGDEGPDGRRLGWVTRFAGLLGLPATRLVNLASYGATTQDVMTSQLGAALVNKPPLVGFLAGVNDLLTSYHAERFQANVSGIFEAVCGADTVVFTATYPEVPRIAPMPGPIREVVRQRFAEANGFLRHLVAKYDVLCLDIAASPEWADPALWSADGLHPGPRGHRRFAEDMAELVGSVKKGAGRSTGETW